MEKIKYCDYCRPSDDKEWKSYDYKIDFGILDEANLSLNIFEGKIQLQMDNQFEELFYEDIQINYCPFVVDI